MSLNNNFNLRDLQKNVDNIRIEHLVEAVEGAKLNDMAVPEKEKGFQAKLYVDVQALNAEEMSLLRDSTPLPSYAGGKFVATYRLGKQFMEENKDNLQQLLIGKLNQAVTTTYDARMAKANEGVVMQNSKLPAPKEEGFFARLVGSFSNKKPAHQESSMGMR